MLQLGGRELRDVREELDDGAREPVALVGRVRAAPVVLHGEGQSRPEVQGEGDALFEGGLAGCWTERCGVSLWVKWWGWRGGSLVGAGQGREGEVAYPDWGRGLPCLKFWLSGFLFARQERELCRREGGEQVLGAEVGWRGC